MNHFKNIKKLKGDASIRIFFRKKIKNFSSIMVFSRKEKKSNLLNYDSINKILIRNNILAPKLISENYSNNYIEIQDFGNETILSLLKKNKVNKTQIFKKIIKLLIKIQNIRQTKVKNFKKNTYKIPLYTPNILFGEAKLFSDWYIKKKLPISKQITFKKKFLKILKILINNLISKKRIFVHRDFHVSNLMMVKKQIGIIDSQDALIGNKAYDLASLIDDVRFRTSVNLKVKTLKYYFKFQKNINKKNFINDFEIISVLRNLKIIGIFSRLAQRDKKKKYLKLIPHAWDLIDLRSKDNKFNDLNDLLSNLRKGKI
tara:strand:- start:7653 stop:8597 length:945 start_codon:yes stop_codon:yes gene_type:complete